MTTLSQPIAAAQRPETVSDRELRACIWSGAGMVVLFGD